MVGKIVPVLWLLILAAWLLTGGPKDDPPSAPSGVGLAHGYPVHYTSPAPLSARVGQHSGPVRVYDGKPAPWPDTGADYGDDDEPLTYEDRYSPEAIGPDWAWAEAATQGCPIATGAVKAQGVGE